MTKSDCQKLLQNFVVKNSRQNGQQKAVTKIMIKIGGHY